MSQRKIHTSIKNLFQEKQNYFRPSMLRFIITILCILFLTAKPTFANEEIGTVLGDVTHQTAKLWVYAEENEKLEFQLTPDVADIKIVKSEYSSTSHFIFVEGLKANTDYLYKVLINGELSSLSSGRFKTNPIPDEPSKFSVAVISCLKKSDVDWTILENEKPDYLLMLGDNIYTHSKKKDSFEKMRNTYLNFRKNKDFVTLVKNRPTLAIWDDHDMGPNDSDGTLEGKEESLESFMDAWPNPSYGVKNIPGVFFTKQHGDVDFFMLDGRFHRQPKKTNDARMLGDDQFSWFLEKLKSSQAVFKIIACGSPINHIKPKDGWESWPWARKRLYKAIADNNITGVIFLGGDLHFADIEKISTKKTGIPYPIYNIVSSGFSDTRSRTGWNYSRQKHPYVILNIDTTLQDPALEIIIKDSLKTYTKVQVKASDLK